MEGHCYFWPLLGLQSCGHSFIFVRSWAEADGGEHGCTAQQSACKHRGCCWGSFVCTSNKQHSHVCGRDYWPTQATLGPFCRAVTAWMQQQLAASGFSLDAAKRTNVWVWTWVCCFICDGAIIGLECLVKPECDIYSNVSGEYLKIMHIILPC